MNSTIFCNVFYQPTNKFWQAIRHFSGVYGNNVKLQPINGGSQLPDDSRILKDNTGDSVSHLNKCLNEWSSLYWMWKNASLDDIDYVGHCHYRLFFKKLPKELTDDIYCANSIPMLFRAGSSVVCGSIEDGYRLCHVSYDWDLLDSIIPPEDKALFCEWKRQNALNAPCQMFLMKKNLFNSYMEYAWPMISQLRGMISLDGRDGYQYRALAFLGERLLSFWTYKMAAEGKCVKALNIVKLDDLKPETATDVRGNFNF